MNRRLLLPAFGTGAALGVLATLVDTTPSCALTPVPAAEHVSGGLATLIERHRIAALAQEVAGKIQAQAERNSMRTPCAENDATFQEADAVFDAACERSIDAMDAIVALPIATLADMRAKAAYLAQIMPGTCEHNGTVAALLASMGGAAPEASELTPEPDPLLDLVNLYRNARDGLEARHIENDDDFDAEMDRLINPLWQRLKYETPTATTEAGAIAALRLAHEEGQHSVGSFDKSLVAAALSYFEGRV